MRKNIITTLLLIFISTCTLFAQNNGLSYYLGKESKILYNDFQFDYTNVSKSDTITQCTAFQVLDDNSHYKPTFIIDDVTKIVMEIHLDPTPKEYKKLSRQIKHDCTKVVNDSTYNFGTFNILKGSDYFILYNK